MRSGAEAYRRRLDDIHGWFGRQDLDVFGWFLTRQGAQGDLLEMGPYLGRSSVLMGYHLRSAERLVVCDLWGAPSGQDSNDSENVGYARPERQAFETNYGLFHAEPPVVLQCSTSELADRLPPQSMRFVHVDASHLYDQVAQDISTAKQLLQPDGILVCDDYRSAHTPGTAAAVWEALHSKGLQPICVTAQKFYGTFGDAEPWRNALREAPPAGQSVSTQSVLGQDLHVLTSTSVHRGATALARLSSRAPRPISRLLVRAYLAWRAPQWVLEEPMLAAQLGGQSGVDVLRLVAGPGTCRGAAADGTEHRDDQPSRPVRPGP